MTPQRWARIKDIFGEAFERQEAERAAFLASACEGDAELRAEVERLLAESGDSLPSPANAFLTPELSPGDTVAHYRIQEKLGEGGMGVVYKASDSRLGRSVALKFVRTEFSSRSQREARAVASLNHPNICTLHDVGPNYLVMELVEGPTLAERIAKGPIPIPEALDIARQIAEALEAAHEKGIVHRDLKPANIKLTAEGKVKVLDFGLAKALVPAAEDSPTLTVTGAGVIIGTPAYMSPEQASGKPVDKRADIWSFGVVLWEMLTGSRLFVGETVTQTLADVLRGPIDFDKLPRETPGTIKNLLRRCLDRDAKTRLRDIGEARVAIDSRGTLESAPGDRRPWLAWSVAGVLAVGLVAISFLYLREKPAAPNAMPDLALSIVPPSGLRLTVVGGVNVDRISPDGSTVLFRTSDGRFHLRRLSSLQDHLMPLFRWYGSPFWAPDSNAIVFPTVNGLIKMQVPAGAPEVFTTRSAERGGSWGEKGIILVAGYGSSPGSISLYGVTAEGGKSFPVEVAGLKEGRYYNPAFLPGSDDFLFSFCPLDSAETRVFIATLRGGKAVDPQLLFSNDTAAAFTSAGGGRILFVRNDNLYAQRLDVKGRRLAGDAELVQERVASHAEFRTANFSVSNTGTLAWRSGTALVSQVAVFDRKGNRVGMAGTAVPAAGGISLAPDEAHLLVMSEAGSWVMESNGPGGASLGSAVPRFWSADGLEVVGVRGGEVVHRPVSGSHEFQPWPNLPSSNWALKDISTDGRRILYTVRRTSLGWFSLDQHRSETIVEQPADNAALSPDGSWAVYQPLSEPGIYVQPLTNPGLRRQIATRGTYAVWRKDGKEIVYWDQDRVWSVRVDGTGAQLRFAPGVPLFPVTAPLGMMSGSRPLAISRDGSRIYFLQSMEEPDSGVIHVRTRAIH